MDAGPARSGGAGSYRRGRLAGARSVVDQHRSGVTARPFRSAHRRGTDHWPARHLPGPGPGRADGPDAVARPLGRHRPPGRLAPLEWSVHHHPARGPHPLHHLGVRGLRSPLCEARNGDPCRLLPRRAGRHRRPRPAGVGRASPRREWPARRLRYETWYFIHLYTYLAIALSFSHQLATGNEFITHPANRLLWVGLYILTFGSARRLPGGGARSRRLPLPAGGGGDPP